MRGLFSYFKVVLPLLADGRVTKWRPLQIEQVSSSCFYTAGPFRDCKAPLQIMFNPIRTRRARYLCRADSEVSRRFHMFKMYRLNHLLSEVGSMLVLTVTFG